MVSQEDTRRTQSGDDDATYALKTFKNRLLTDFENMQTQLQRVFEKALLDGSTNPLAVFADFIGSSQALLGNYLPSKSKQPTNTPV